MNGLERYMATVLGEERDHPPRVPILMQYAAEYIGSNYGAFASDYRVMVEANLACARDFGMDQVSTISDPYRETEGFGAEIIFVRDGVPRCPKPPLAEFPGLDRLPRPVPRQCARMLDRIQAVESYHRQIGGQYSILGWIEGPIAEAADLRGVNEFLTDLMDDEAYSGELMDRCVENGIRFAQEQIAVGADTIGIGDALASQISPSLYERLILPREKQLIDGIHEAGSLVRLHICGNITHLLPGIASLGVDILDVDHMVDMKVVRKVVGNRVVLTGNIDPVAGVRNGTPKSIREYVRRIHEEAGEPYMINAGCEIPPGTAVENVVALCSALG